MPFIQHTVLFKFPAIEGIVPPELAEIVAKFGTLSGIVADFFPHGAGAAPGATNKASFLEAVSWPDKTEGYTHCLLILASDAAALKAYLHGDFHQKLWFPAVGPYLKGIVVFDNVLEPDIIQRLETKLRAAGAAGRDEAGGSSGLCAVETPSTAASVTRSAVRLACRVPSAPSGASMSRITQSRGKRTPATACASR